MFAWTRDSAMTSSQDTAARPAYPSWAGPSAAGSVRTA